MSKQVFELGQVVATPAALEFLERHSLTPMPFLQRHCTGDFGDLCDEDREANNEAVQNDERILSSYKIGDEKIWIITEADRSSTSIYTIVFTNTTLGRSVEEGLNVWVCENVQAFRQSLSVLKEKPHLRVISAGPSVVKRQE